MSITLEFHCHTHASKDSLTKPADLIRIARKKGINRLVVTDHNTIAGALEAQTIDPELIIVGEEIMTTKGEILAAFVSEEIPAGLSPQETISRLKAQGAFISVSHPFDAYRQGGWQEVDLLDILPMVDAIEIFNSRCLNESFNDLAFNFAKKHNIPATVGSDAHAAFEAGQSLMILDPFEGAEGMRSVIRGAKYKIKASPAWVHLVSRYAVFRKKMAPYKTKRI